MISKDSIAETIIPTKQPVSFEIAQHITISKQGQENHSTRPINICLIDQFNEVVDKTDVVNTNDDEQNEVVTKLRIICRTRHQNT